MMVIKMIWY